MKSLENKYTGYITLNDEQMSRYYSEDNPIFPELLENQYVFLPNNKGKICEKLRCTNMQTLQPINFHKIDNEYSGLITPRNPQQELAFDLLQNRQITIKLLTGKFGSGKTMLMVLSALDALQKQEYERIVWVRNNIEVKDTVPFGALPGGEFNKLLPWAMPLADHVGGIDGMLNLIDNKQLEIQHLGFMRGRDIKKSIIISSEAENLTKDHVQLLIGRVGEGSTLWLDGDLKQVDKQVFANKSGISVAIDKLKGNPLFGYVHLQKSERSQTAQLADLLDDEE